MHSLLAVHQKILRLDITKVVKSKKTDRKGGVPATSTGALITTADIS